MISNHSAVALVALAMVTNASAQEPNKAVDVVNPHAGRTTIILLKPWGTRVKAGEMVCELDASAVKELLGNQLITTKAAEAAHQNARLTREISEIAVTEYFEGIYAQDLATVNGEIALSKSDQERARERLEWSKTMRKSGHLLDGTVISDELALQKANFLVEQAATKKAVLEKYTKGKTIKEFRAEIEKCKANELAKKATCDLEKTIENRIESHLRSFQIVAPIAGRVAYPRAIEADTVYRQGDVLFRIVPDDQTNAGAK